MTQTQTAYGLRVRTLVLAEVGRLDEALETARQCVAAYRDAVPRGRDKSLGSFAAALRIQARVLGDMGRVEESVALYLECDALLRAMPPLKVLLRTPMLNPRVLVELTGGLRTLGRYEEAIAVGTDAHEWIDGIPPSFHPDILHLRARLLTDLAWCHWKTGDPSRAGERRAGRDRVPHAGPARPRHRRAPARPGAGKPRLPGRREGRVPRGTPPPEGAG